MSMIKTIKKAFGRLKALFQDKSIKELDKFESYAKVRELIKKQKVLKSSSFEPGNVVFTSYDAKDKTQTYDKTPFVLILSVSKGYTLGLNFHWLPLAMRLYLIEHITSSFIDFRGNVTFRYKDLKPLLKALGYAPCIRLYINGRFAKRGVVIPPDKLFEVARLRSETFTQGKYSSTELFAMARNRARKSKKK